MFPISEAELKDLNKIAAATSTSSYYEDESGEKFSISDIVSGKKKKPAKYKSASKADEVGDPNYGITNVRGVDNK
tara:strand:+ start:1611 stop:1835 length:225 start_codon:yes stop_codon:yes gene_type:complete